MIDIGKMTTQLKAEEAEVFASLREAADESAALEALREFSVYPLMRRAADIQAFAQAQGWHSPAWADVPSLGLHEPSIGFDFNFNPTDSLTKWLESGLPAAEWPAYSFGLWRSNGRTWEQWREAGREAWIGTGTGDWHSWEYYAHEAWLKCGKSDVSVSMELVIQWDWQAYCQRCWWGITQYPPIPDWFRKAWEKRQATAAQRELAGTIPDAGELKPPAPAPQQAQSAPPLALADFIKKHPEQFKQENGEWQTAQSPQDFCFWLANLTSKEIPPVETVADCLKNKVSLETWKRYYRDAALSKKTLRAG